MKRWPLLLLLLIILSICVTLAFATNFNSSVSPATADSGLTNKFLNFTITNNGPGNIRRVNITLYNGITFVLDSNKTTASNVNFTNISTTEISWYNNTAAGFIDTTPQGFGFNVSIPKNIYGNVNFNISIYNTTNHFNSTNVSVYIERTIWSSPLGQFYVKPVGIYLNWTNNYASNVTITLNETFNNITIEILNGTSVSENYTQSNTPTDCRSGYKLYVRNASGDYNNIIGPLTATTSTTNVTLSDNIAFNHLTCKPGRYWIEKLTIRNTTQQNETANVTVIIDIPISSFNNANLPLTGVASFSGQIPLNATTYQSYFFNISDVGNATGIYINISGWSSSQDVDLFLFDNSTIPTLLAKSINKTSTNESLFYSFLPNTPAMYEIRLFGNSTSNISYSGNIIFTTLNSTSSALDFGVKNVSTTTTQNFILNNTGNINLSSVTELKEFYWINRVLNNVTRNFTLLVPDSSIASKVKVSLNWTGLSNYSFNLYKPDNSLAASSVNKHVYANITGAMQEEYGETTDITKGTWTIEVKNDTSTTTTDNYTLTSYIYVNASQWVTSNYTTMSFNTTGNPNSTDPTQVNFTVPNNTMNGLYEGYIRYVDSRNAGITIPITVNVTVPMLVVNNTLDSQTFRVDEDYGKNLTRILYFNINNPGIYNLSVNFTDSGNLSCYSGSCSSGLHNASFAYNTTSSIPANSSRLINVSITFNSSLPAAVYQGWIKIYSNSTDFNLTAHPYQNFTITLILNLTNLLDVRPTGILSSRTIGGNPSVYNNDSLLAENITVESLIYYINSTTQIEAKEALTTSNFSVWLTETNTSYRIPTTGNLSIYNGTNPLYYNNVYSLTVSTPASQPGGRYNVNVNASYIKDSFSYWGVGANNSLFINNTGLHMSTNATGCMFNATTPCNPSISISNQSGTYKFFVNVSNFGPKIASNSYINFNRPSSCSGYTISYTDATSGCFGGGINSTVTVPAHNTSCLIWYSITAGTTAADACTANIIGSPTYQWFNPNGINVSITVTAPSGGVAPGGGVGGAAPSYAADLAFTKAESLVVVQQKSSNTTTVVVKNTGNKSQTITFAIEDINSTWYAVNSTNAILAVNKEAAFKVTFAVDKVAIKNYPGVYKAYSSEKTIKSNFTLRVIPSPEEEVVIADRLTLYKLNMSKLSEEINQTKATGVNATKAEAKFSELKSKINEAEGYINQSDYFSAYQLFDDIEALMSEIKTELETAKQERAKFVLTTVAIAVAAVAIAGVLIYLFWPTKPSYKPGKGKYVFKPPREESKVKDVWEQLKEKWSKARKEEFKPELRPIKKESVWDKLKGILGKITQIFKRK